MINFKSNRVYIILAIVTTFFIFMGMRVYRLKQQRLRIIFYDDYDNSSNTEVYGDHSVEEYKTQVDNILNIRAKIDRINREEKVYNEYLYGPVSFRTSLIVIKVTTKLVHLRQLLQSLQQVAGILRSFLIFVHDYYDDEIQLTINAVSFTRYMQVFYPFSSQLHPTIFPGNDPYDCTNNYHCEKSNNRYAELAQEKHLWWWTMNHIFDHLEVTKYFNEYILFLEEDQYVAEDLIYMLKLYKKAMPDYCPECEMICLGARIPDLSQYHVTEGPTVIEDFGTTDFQMGISFNRSVWNTIKKFKNYFCYYNDYKWSNSLQYLATKKPPLWLRAQGSFIMFSSLGTRVFQIGKCNLPYPDSECTVNERLQEILLFLKLARRGLYPRKVVFHHFPFQPHTIDQSGGWTDDRDHEFCMFMASKMRYRFKV